MENEATILRLKGERLILRQLEKHDVDDVLALFSNPNVMKYDGGTVLTTKSQAEHYVYAFSHPHLYQVKDSITWAFIEKKSGNFIGTGGLKNWFGSNHAEIGAVIGEAYWGQSYGREALQAILYFAFNKLKLDYVYAATHPENKRAHDLLHRLGFQFQGWNHNYVIGDQYMKVKIYIKKNHY